MNDLETYPDQQGPASSVARAKRSVCLILSMFSTCLLIIAVILLISVTPHNLRVSILQRDLQSVSLPPSTVVLRDCSVVDNWGDQGNNISLVAARVCKCDLSEAEVRQFYDSWHSRAHKSVSFLVDDPGGFEEFEKPGLCARLLFLDRPFQDGYSLPWFEQLIDFVPPVANRQGSKPCTWFVLYYRELVEGGGDIRSL